MLQDILFALWFLLPAAVANAAPVFAAAIPALKKYSAPIDAGTFWHGHRLLGSHKTWRGIVAGVIAATLVLWVQQLLYTHTSWAAQIAGGVNYTALPLLLLGPLFALGALGGDALKSFFKRRFNIRSGKSWLPFDQIDYIIGSLLVTLPFVVLTPMQYIVILIVWFLAHLLASYMGYKLHLKKDPI